MTIKDLILSDDPLSEDAVRLLLNYQEEDSFVDYKLTFENDEKDWLEITKDVLAFSNTYGGYLVFGIRDATYEKIGLSEEVLGVTSNANNIMQKVNRYIDPLVNSLRTKIVEEDGKKFSILFIPPSLDKTHIISKDASFKYQSGKEKKILNIGTTQVRRSAGNHMMDSRDLDDIVNRRISYFKESLMDKIARVVDSPKESEVLIVTEESGIEDQIKIVVKDAPDAIPIIGKSFDVSPETTEEEIMGWISMNKHDKSAIPAPGIIWKWYKERKSLKLSKEQMLEVAKFSLMTGAPVFYWLVICDAGAIKTMLLGIISNYSDISIIGDTIAIGAFLGNRVHKDLIAKIGNMIERLSPIKKSVPKAGAKVLFNADRINLNQYNREDIEAELDAIVLTASANDKHIPVLQSRWRAITLDCVLYSRDDQYVFKKNT